MKRKRQAISRLNDLIEKNLDACEGYKKAAEKAESPALKSFLNDYSLQRDQFVIDLSNEIINLGGTPRDKGSFSGDLHRTWIDMKTALSADKDESVLQACIKGEQAALDEYNQVLRELRVAGTTGNLLRNQQRSVENAYNRVKSLESLL